jgi:hypothetical protein
MRSRRRPGGRWRLSGSGVAPEERWPSLALAAAELREPYRHDVVLLMHLLEDAGCWPEQVLKKHPMNKASPDFPNRRVGWSGAFS